MITGKLKEKSILYKPAMAQASHDGIKTHTRRVIKPQPIWVADPHTPFKTKDANPKGIINCDYGYKNSLLWVKEEHYIYGKWIIDGLTKKTRKPKFNFVDLEIMPVKFPKNKPTIIEKDRTEIGYFKRNSLYMPKKYCRTWLKIKDILVERLQDISEENAIAEGIESEHEYDGTPEFGYDMGLWYKDYIKKGVSHSSAIKSFMSLWDSINGQPRKDGKDISWAANPWVWVIEFERIKKCPPKTK